jgi:hypothetical protein
MNRMATTLNIIIKSSIKSTKQSFPLQICSDFTIFQIKQEIEKIENVSADWIILWNAQTYRYLENDNALVSDAKINEGDTLQAEFRYKFDECLPTER